MRSVAAVALAVALAGCATQQTYLQRKSSELQPLLAAGKYDVAVAVARRDFDYDDSDSTTIRREIAKHPGAVAAVAARFRSEIESANDAKSIEGLPKALQLAHRDGVIGAADATALRASLTSRVDAALRSGAIAFDLANTEVLDAIPELSTPANKKLLFYRSLKEIPSASGARKSTLLERTFVMAKAGGKGDVYDTAIRTGLHTFGLSTPEIRQYVSPYDAAWAQQLLETRVKRVALRSEPPDRLLEEDVKELLRQRDEDIEFVNASGSDRLTITVGKLQYEERPDQERKQTITYQQHEVNLLGAVLLMPRNASYMYEHVTGGLDVTSAFLIKIANSANLVVDKVFRERASRRYNHCENARIVNVFGGVQRAEFVANDDMARRCGGGTSVRPDATEVRAEILSKVADEIVSHLKK